MNQSSAKVSENGHEHGAHLCGKLPVKQAIMHGHGAMVTQRTVFAEWCLLVDRS